VSERCLGLSIHGGQRALLDAETEGVPVVVGAPLPLTLRVSGTW
jgi:hypothetical protein